ncbi:Uma2 family endonuclease [Mucilaginibacter sp.]
MLATEQKKYTVADYEMLEQGAPFQLINYDLIMSPSPSLQHQEILYELSEAIVLHNVKYGRLGKWLYAPMDVYLNDGNAYQPDVFFIKTERLSIIENGKINGSPDLIVEILSPSNAYYDLRQKKDIYEQFGVQEYIIIDPMAQSAEVYRLQNGAYQLTQKAKLQGALNSQVLPGFQLELSKLFR